MKTKEELKEYKKQWYLENRERILIRNKDVYLKNREEILKLNKVWRDNHKESIRKHNSEYYNDNKIKILNKQNDYHKTHRVQAKLYKKEHREEIAKYAKEYDAKRYIVLREKKIKQSIEYNKMKMKTDVNFKIVRNLRNRLWYAVKGLSKSKHTLELLGCSIENLKLHLESKFQPGMSFSNYGKWHIDHIKPCASFDLSKSSEQRKCFNYLNLQPLWAEENFKKHDKF
jgi:hypothetical protein